MAVLHLLARDNNALAANPPAGDAHLVTHGSNWLWAVAAVFMLTFLVIFFMTPRTTTIPGEKTFHHILLIATLVGAITYYASASDLGWSVVSQVNSRSHGLTRQIFFTKYIFWVVAFPAQILVLGLLSITLRRTILYQIVLAWIWIIAYLVGAYTQSNYKWGFFALGTLALIFLAISTFLDGREHETNVRKHHKALLGYIVFLWMLYPIAWGLSDGGNRIGVTSGFVFFGILDLFSVAFFSYAVLVVARSFDHSAANNRTNRYGDKSIPATGGPMTAS